jgi:hypothetical protein
MDIAEIRDSSEFALGIQCDVAHACAVNPGAVRIIDVRSGSVQGSAVVDLCLVGFKKQQLLHLEAQTRDPRSALLAGSRTHKARAVLFLSGLTHEELRGNDTDAGYKEHGSGWRQGHVVLLDPDTLQPVAHPLACLLSKQEQESTQPLDNHTHTPQPSFPSETSWYWNVLPSTSAPPPGAKEGGRAGASERGKDRKILICNACNAGAEGQAKPALTQHPMMKVDILQPKAGGLVKVRTARDIVDTGDNRDPQMIHGMQSPASQEALNFISLDSISSSGDAALPDAFLPELLPLGECVCVYARANVI